MTTYSFIIFGNHEDHSGNPIAKFKKTIRQKLTPDAKRYLLWKGHVQRSLFDSLTGIDYTNQMRIMNMFKKPIKLFPEESAVMDVKIYWRDGHHGDPENIFGSIADALFYDEKHLHGSFNSEMSTNEKGRVEVKITINDDL